MISAFEGLRVIELAHIYNGPYCGLLFAHLGAEVIKVEPPGGERLRSRARGTRDPHEFVMLNSNKKSVVLDLKTDAGRAQFLALVADADVLIENYSPGALQRLGLSSDVLLSANPRLVIGSGKGYGNSGPYADFPAMDLTVQAMSGAMSTTGFPGGDPVKAGPAFTDFSGGIHLFAAVLAGLLERNSTGAGGVVEVSMHDTIFPMLTSAVSSIVDSGGDDDILERTGNRHSGLSVVPYNTYPTRDGWVSLIASSETHWRALVDSLMLECAEDPRFESSYSRSQNIDAVDVAVAAKTSEWLRDELCDELRRNGVPSAPVKSLHEVLDDPHLHARGMIQYVMHPENGKVPVIGNPLRVFGDSGSSDLSPAPAVGADQKLLSYIDNVFLEQDQ